MDVQQLPHPQKDEEILLLLRRHPWILIRLFLYFILLAAIGIGAYMLLRYVEPSWFGDHDDIRMILVVIGSSVYALAIWLFLFTGWLDYYLDVWILTNQRVISMELRGLFARTTAEQHIGRVQDVSSIQQGKLATLLNYGHVQIQTAGSKVVFVFAEIPNPEVVARQVLQAHDQWMQRHPKEAREMLPEMKAGMSGPGEPSEKLGIEK